MTKTDLFGVYASLKQQEANIKTQLESVEKELLKRVKEAENTEYGTFFVRTTPVYEYDVVTKLQEADIKDKIKRYNERVHKLHEIAIAQGRVKVVKENKSIVLRLNKK